MVDTRDLKSLGHCGCAGSSPDSVTFLQWSPQSIGATFYFIACKMKKTVIHEGYEHMEMFIESLPDIFERDGVTLWQARNVVKRFSVDGEEIVVKHYKSPNAVQRIAYSFFRPGKAKRAYCYADEMLKRGIYTPAPVAYIEVYRHGLLNDSYFLSTVTDYKPLFPVLVDTPDYDTSLAEAAAIFMASLHAKEVLHGDPNLNNILYKQNPGKSVSFCLIDTNRSRFGEITHKDAIKNIMRLTHRRDLLEMMTRRYAEIRGWNPDATVAEVMDEIKNFEMRRMRKYRFKHLGHLK